MHAKVSHELQCDAHFIPALFWFPGTSVQSNITDFWTKHPAESFVLFLPCCQIHTYKPLPLPATQPTYGDRCQGICCLVKKNVIFAGDSWEVESGSNLYVIKVMMACSALLSSYNLWHLKFNHATTTNVHVFHWDFIQPNNTKYCIFVKGG